MSDLNKTLYYLKRNGLKNTYYAVKERLLNKEEALPFPVPSEGELKAQKESALNKEGKVKFSILVPVYETPERFLREMIESVLNQSYENFELIIGDASKSEGPSRIIRSYQAGDKRIVYFKISENKGISANTNECLQVATGDYVGLLDHDDLLTPDALYFAAKAIIDSDFKALFLYSDEDKCNGEATEVFEANLKPDYNKDLLYSNNYICHFSVFEANLIRNLKFRPEYDGAQDYDLILRAVKTIDDESKIKHIARVLYHWRCHEASTAANPASKDYAYEAGLRALSDITGEQVSHLMHKGFYYVNYGADDTIFEKRPDLAAVGGFIIRKKKIVSGILDRDGSIEYFGMPAAFSGYMHRAHLTQDVYALDIRNMRVNPRLMPEFNKLKASLTAENFMEKSLEWAEITEKMGLKLRFDPNLNIILRKD